MLFSFSGINLEVVILGQCTWKAPKKAIPPKETEKPESDFNLNFHLFLFHTILKIILVLLQISPCQFVLNSPISMQQVKSFYAEAIVTCKLIFNIMWKNLNTEGKQFFYLINARGKCTEFCCFSFSIYLVWAK